MKKMKEQAVREVGQLSFHRFKRLSRINGSNEKDIENKSPTKKMKKNPCISLSDFLNRKLVSTTSTQTKSVQESKLKPFSSLVGSKDTVGAVNKHVGDKRGAAKVIEHELERTIFERFKCPRKENEDFVRSSSGAGGTDDEQHFLRKRRNTFHVSSLDERNTAPRHVLVLGDDAKCKQNRRAVSFNRGSKAKPVFNHYANGSGWWDCNMEGIDNEVGCNEAWEGVGSTTLGGLEWH